MKTKALSLLLLGFLSSPWKAQSLTNTAWVETAVDKISGPNVLPNEFQLQRTYHSQSLFRGLLGFGWCLEFDKVLKPQPNGDLLYESCEFDSRLRFRLSHQKNETLIYISSHPNEFRVTQKDNLYTLTEITKGHRWVFNTQGQLVEWQRSTEPRRQLVRNRLGRLQSLIWKKNLIIQIEQDPSTGFITRFTSGRRSIQMTYQDDLLTQVQDSFMQSIYRYDSLANLTLSMNSQGLEKKIQYDELTDQVIGVEVARHQIRINHLGLVEAVRSPQGSWLELRYSSNGLLQQIQIEKTQFNIQAFQQLPVDHPTRTAIESSLRVASFSQIHIAQN